MNRVAPALRASPARMRSTAASAGRTVSVTPAVRPDAASAGTHPHSWRIVAAALFLIAWGGNEFTPLMVMYRRDFGIEPVTVFLLLFAYVLGIVPALLVGAPLSDRFGRRPLALPAVPIAILGSLVLALGAHSAVVLFSGRVLSGVAIGLGTAVAGSWAKELSAAPYDGRADSGAGARRAAMSLTAGFALGAAVAGALAQWFPGGDKVPYLVHIALCVPVAITLFTVPETRAGEARAEARRPLRIVAPEVRHPRFLLVIAPAAPWVFGAAGVAYAILPGLLADRADSGPIAFSALLCLVALGSGFFIQAVGRRIDTRRSARAILVSYGFVISGMLLGAGAAHQVGLGSGLLAGVVLGCGYGMVLVSGLHEVQRLASPDSLAALTAAFYTLAYTGFAFPAILAALSEYVGYAAMLLAGAGVAVVTLLGTAVFSHRFLPAARTERGCVV